jgi:hypothetical protein
MENRSGFGDQRSEVSEAMTLHLRSWSLLPSSVWSLGQWASASRNTFRMPKVDSATMQLKDVATVLTT